MSPKNICPPGPGADKEHSVYAEDGLKRESSAPCQLNCPAGIDVPSYIALIGQGKYQEAIDVIREDNPFPWVCGLICPNPCESWCQRRYVDKALCIKDLEGLAAKMVNLGQSYTIPKPEVRYEEKVAVIGAGPAGLSAAYFLAKKGYPITVFESMPEAGGMLITGIPEYKLPREVIRKEIQSLKAMGIEFKTNTTIGESITLDDLRKEGYKAFFLGIGAWNSTRLAIEGEDDFPQVIDVLTFLKDVSFGNKTKPADDVAIVGGGNAAIDAARTCVRLGCRNVSILYRRTRSEMPAHFEEIIQAAEEGIHFHQLTIPTKIIGSNGKVQAIECSMASLGEPDESGRRRPVPIPDSSYKMPVGAVIRAIGQKPHISEIPGLGMFTLSKKETIKTSSKGYQSNIPDVFAAGDAVTGPSTVVGAIGAAKKAARGIHAFLRDLPIEKSADPRPRRMVEPIKMNYREKAFIQRQEIPLINLQKRLTTFDQVELGLNEAAAKEEAKRCMRCDVCERCGKCMEVCREKLGSSAIRFYHAGENSLILKDYVHELPHCIGENSLILKDYVHGLPHCIGCGTCVNICPTGALQMEENGDERSLIMCGTVINKVKMKKCEGCGKHFAPKGFLKNLGEKVGVPGYTFKQDLCPACRKIAAAARMNNEEPDFSAYRKEPTQGL